MIDVDWDLLFRYLGGECTDRERAAFERWLAADPTHGALLQAAAMAGERVLATAPVAVHTEPARGRSIVRRVPLIAAAMLAAAASVALALRFTASAKRAVVEPIEVARTGRGQRDTLRLADGTRVILGPASTLRRPARFADTARDVVLTGEAYFEVAHESGRPFRVHAGDAMAEDLGTAFGVRAFPEDSAVRVVVAEGSVALGPAPRSGVRRAGTRAVLAAGELGRLGSGNSTPSIERVDVDAYLGWTRGELVFDDTPLADVAAQLGRTYGRDVRLADEALGSRRVTGRFRDEPLPLVLAALGATLDVRFESSGDTIVVRAREPRR